MKIQIEKSTLLPALSQVISVVEKRQTLPILGNVYIKTENGNLTLVGSDLETEITTGLENVKCDDGEITVSARKFFDICKALPDSSEIELHAEDNKMKVQSGKSKFSLQTLAANEYPRLESTTWDMELTLTHKELSSLFSSTAFAMAQQDVRYFLNGLLLEIGEDAIKTVATDGHRLAKNEMNHSAALGEIRQSIIPRKAVQEIIKFVSADSDDNIHLKLNNSHISITSHNYRFISKLIDGRYPEYQKVIPNNLDKSIIVDKSHLAEILTRTAILSNEKFRGISVAFKPGVLVVTSRNPDHEEATDEMAIDYQGEEIEIGFNVNYLQDAIRECGSEKVHFFFKDPSTSGIIKEENNAEKLYVIMPMRI